MESSEFIWMDGEFVKWEDANIHVLSHSLHYGSAIFEGIRCYETVDGPSVFRLPEHTDRFFRGCNLYRHTLDFTAEQFNEAILETIQKNNLKECYVRPIAFYELGTIGVRPVAATKRARTRVAIIAFPWGAYLGEEGLKNGIKVLVSSWKRVHHSQFYTSAKASGAYLNAIAAVMDAQDKGFDECLMLDMNGYVAEGSGENIFIVRDGVVWTNDGTNSILEGITRDCVMTIAKDLGLELQIRNISRADLSLADEIFLCGTAAEVTPVRQVDHFTIGNGSRGPITEKIQSKYFEIIRGKDENYKRWHTPAYTDK